MIKINPSGTFLARHTNNEAIKHMEFSFNRSRIDKISRETLSNELCRIAELCQLSEFGKREFDALASISSQSVIREFGSWSNAISYLRSELAPQGKTLLEKRRGYFTETECLMELERIWQLLGHRPSKTEWENSTPGISYTTYKRYFGSWTQACLRFLETRTGNQSILEARDELETKALRKSKQLSRDIPAGLRLRVYERDRYRCIYCGQSPLINQNIQLHIDHIYPFSRGGETKLENLQTLCSLCNLGKGDRIDVTPPNA